MPFSHYYNHTAAPRMLEGPLYELPVPSPTLLVCTPWALAHWHHPGSENQAHPEKKI